MLLSIICKHSFASDDPNTIMQSVSHCGCAQPRGAVVKPFRSSGKSFFFFFFRNGLDTSAQNVSCSRNEDDVKQSKREKTQHALRPFLWSNLEENILF